MTIKTTDCSCEIVSTRDEDEPGTMEDIIYCPLHKSAPALLKACERVLERLNVSKTHTSCINELENAINKSQVGELSKNI